MMTTKLKDKTELESHWKVLNTVEGLYRINKTPISPYSTVEGLNRINKTPKSPYSTVEGLYRINKTSISPYSTDKGHFYLAMLNLAVDWSGYACGSQVVRGLSSSLHSCGVSPAPYSKQESSHIHLNQLCCNINIDL